MCIIFLLLASNSAPGMKDSKVQFVLKDMAW